VRTFLHTVIWLALGLTGAVFPNVPRADAAVAFKKTPWTASSVPKGQRWRTWIETAARTSWFPNKKGVFYFEREW